MIVKKRITLLALLAIFIWQKNHAQSFSYQLTKDSIAYLDLNSPTVLLGNENFTDKHSTIHLPFTFNFCGSVTDSIIVETNGFIVFDQTKSLSLVSFNNFYGNKDSSGNYQAAISYNTSGTQGNRITKIEFKNLSLNTYTYYDNLSYQIWLYENGNIIEYHIGANYCSTQSEMEIPALIGAINQSMDTENKAFLITGNASAPIGHLVSGENDLQYINSIPSSGIIYRLNPSF